jgi:CheY-like chemotaxis protein
LLGANCLDRRDERFSGRANRGARGWTRSPPPGLLARGDREALGVQRGGAMQRIEGLGNGRPCRVLVAEDDADIRALIVTGLKRDGHIVMEVDDGEKLLAAVARGEPAPDVIVMDIRMPRVDGLTALASLRETTTRARVLLLSASVDPATRARAERLEPDAFLRKPFDVFELRELIWKMARAAAAAPR